MINHLHVFVIWITNMINWYCFSWFKGNYIQLARKPRMHIVIFVIYVVVVSRVLNFETRCHFLLETWRCYDVESTSMTFIQRRNNVVCPIGIGRKKHVFSFVRLSNLEQSNIESTPFVELLGGGPRVAVSTAAFHARDQGSVPGLGGLKETKKVSSPSTCESQYCGEPPWPRGSVLGLRPPGLEFRILCLEDSVISFISPSSGGSPGPV